MALHPVDQGVLRSLNSFHSQFFSSLKGNSKALTSFLSAWASFSDTIDKCCDQLQQETRQRVFSFSSTVASVIEGILKTDPIHEEICGEVGSILDSIDATDPLTSQAPLPSQAPYIKLASKWLFSNLHNPYPSQEVRASMATQTSSSKKDIDHWFADARKRIGWNDMRRKHFNNKRVSVVSAAKSFFLNIDTSWPLPPMVESEFASVQLRAKELYTDKFEESPLAVSLDMSLINTGTGFNAKLEGGRPRKRHTPSTAKAAHYYPSPEPSPTGSSNLKSVSPSPMPSYPDLPSFTSKRGQSVLSETENEEERPSKRRRPSKVDESRSPSLELQRHPLLTSTEASLLSPVSSTFDESEFQPPPHYPTLTAPVPHKRKRRLSDISDSEALPSPKRTRPGSSRLQNVCDPLPMSQPTLDEFNWDQLLDFSTLPPPVSLLSPEDITGPIDVSLFEFPSWEQHGCGLLNPSPSEEPIIASSSSDTLRIGAIDDFPAQSDTLNEDFSVFNWNAYDPMGPECRTETLSTSASELYNLPNISSDFAPLPGQWMAPIALSVANGFLPTPAFTDPAPPTLQEAPAQAAPNPTITLSESEREAKAERVRTLQAEIATLTAEIAASS